MNPTEPLPRQHAKEFVKTPDADDYIFTIACTSDENAKRFVQRISVELSRMRNYIRARGLVVRTFRLQLVTFRPINAKEYEITLRKSVPDAQISRDIDDVFANLTTGEKRLSE